MLQGGDQISTSEISLHFTILDHLSPHYTSTARRRVVLVAEGFKDQAEGWMQHHSTFINYNPQKAVDSLYIVSPIQRNDYDVRISNCRKV
ncbi:hypothetical protein GUJ93_ZPchr0009g1744 [Zizania palustris]|uniref:Uncharacterized protein n=1 Tax=Zizania palustris TaxID=103762 RepID=A0A8J5VKJ8_ZIZPA|nr:hypothetical protein GUJ93_ZPchr0009g1744 [Zizania palustris]